MPPSSPPPRLPSAVPRIVTLPIVTPQGCFRASYSPVGLVRLEFPGARAWGRDSQPGSIAPAVRTWHRRVSQALEAALKGGRPKRLPPLDWRGATAFQRRVWAVLLRIPPGCTRSYAEVARAAGAPRGARAVGGACGANPIPVLVPCHRVIGSGGRLGGFSGGGRWKERLLEAEGRVSSR